MDGWRELTLRATGVLLVASAVLGLPGLAGVGSSLLLAGALAVLGVALVAGRSTLAGLPTVLGYDLGRYARDLPLACFGPAVVLVWFGNASPAELQALGGFAGLAGMVNYFLRPVYGYVLSVLAPLRGATEST